MYHTTTRIYRAALELAEDCHETWKGFPTGFGFLTDQLRRASSGVVLNYIEGCGRASKRDRKRFFVSAKASVYEVNGVFDLALRYHIVDAGLAQRAKTRCDQLAGILAKYS